MVRAIVFGCMIIVRPQLEKEMLYQDGCRDYEIRDISKTNPFYLNWRFLFLSSEIGVDASEKAVVRFSGARMRFPNENRYLNLVVFFAFEKLFDK